MGKVAFMFPGQGAQKVGMAQDLYQTDELATRVLDEAQATVDFNLLDTMFKDEQGILNQTENTQPALLTHSMALYAAMGQPQADFTIGHSLGEYSSLVMSGVLAFDDAVKIVRRRGELMTQAFPGGVGGMAAVLGLSFDEVRSICEQLSTETEIVEPANINCPGQIVVSGHQTKIDELVAKGKELGAKRVMPLQVSGPFHSSMMQVIEKDFEAYTSQFQWSDAKIPVVQNVHAKGETDAQTIHEHMIQQLYSPVQFIDSIQWLIDQGVDHFVEIGPGKVLSGLVKKIDRDVKLTSIQTLEDVKEWLNHD